jgi:hypothetical protein
MRPPITVPKDFGKDMYLCCASGLFCVGQLVRSVNGQVRLRSKRNQMGGEIGEENRFATGTLRHRRLRETPMLNPANSNV